jgi:hypothetical protein
MSTRGVNPNRLQFAYQLHMLNKGSEPTCLDSRRQEMLDITICTRDLSNFVREWGFLVNTPDRVPDRFAMPCNKFK